MKFLNYEKDRKEDGVTQIKFLKNTFTNFINTLFNKILYDFSVNFKRDVSMYLFTYLCTYLR